jgi:hypothetical protein
MGGNLIRGLMLLDMGVSSTCGGIEHELDSKFSDLILGFVGVLYTRALLGGIVSTNNIS